MELWKKHCKISALSQTYCYSLLHVRNLQSLISLEKGHTLISVSASLGLT